jgi:tetratricopeptide (TPR) repeat protein
MRAIVLALVIAASAAPAATAIAQPEDPARRRFDRGTALYDEGRFAEAAVEFEACYALNPRPEILYNVYVAHRDAAQHAQAASALRRYLDTDAEIENRAWLRQRLAALEASLAADRAPPPRSEEAPLMRRQERPLRQAAAVPAPGSPRRDDGDGSGIPTATWILAGAAGAMAIGSAVLAFVAAGTYEDLDHACPGGSCMADRAHDLDALATQTTIADALGVAAVVTLGVAVVVAVLMESGS